MLRSPLARCLLSVSLAALLSACATGAPAGARRLLADAYEPFTRPAAPRLVPDAEAASTPLPVSPGARDTALSTAQRLVGKRKIVVNGQRFGDDCTGLVRAAYTQAGVDLMSAAEPGDNGVTAIWRFAARHGRIYTGGHPVAGDLVFFRETYDLNRDGRDNDGLTHVGLVESLEDDGTVIVIHRVARGVVRYRMNLAHRDKATTPGGRRVNDWLRAGGPGAKPRLTAELFAGYATLLPVESRFAGR
ncbi:MAG: CHAP domain-containing protein [Myxococcales bacterium]|nr:CHAP domain-containing protein [Myxococcales bacterium]